MVNVMTSILMSIILMVSILMIGCSNQPPPIPTPSPTPMVMVMVDESLIVANSLKEFNSASNNYVRFLRTTTSIYELYNPMTSEEGYHHVSYVAARIIADSLPVYADAIKQWKPPEESSYYDRLIDMKEAELYRIEHFGELTDWMIDTLPTENEEAIQIVRSEFVAWRDDPLNQKPMDMQNDILKELNIHPDDADFMFIVPDKPLPTLPPIFNEGENRSLWMN